ncbi:MAG: hypothetical protein J7527_17190 [Chitinophagaceae bacterium]|nr:hypothetical protein [Chitinophagaceae bacterium]
MTSEKYAVVFDTNAYRNLTKDLRAEDIKAFIEQLKNKEAAKNIQARATPVVGMELLANLAGPDKSPHYDDCLKALVAMANHCYQQKEDLVHLTPHPYLHISTNFFNSSPLAVELISQNMVGVIMDFKDDYLKAIEGHQFAGTFNNLKKYIEHEEARWASEMEGYVADAVQEVLKKHPSLEPKQLRGKVLQYIDSGYFVPKLSMAIIFGMARSLNIRMTGEEHVAKGHALPQAFPMSVAFYQWVCRRIVADNLDLQSQRSKDTRWNWRWDYEVSFLMNDHLLNGRIVLLITSDKDMIQMLRDYSYDVRVMNLETYLDFLDWKG